MPHPEVDPIQYELLRLATVHDIPFNQCEMAYHIFSNLEISPQFTPEQAMGYVAHACERAERKILVNPFFPYVGLKGSAQEMSDTLLELHTARDALFGPPEELSILDRVMSRFSPHIDKSLTQETDPEVLLKDRPFGTTVQITYSNGKRLSFIKLHRIHAMKAIWSMPPYPYRVLEDIRGVFYPMAPSLTGQVLPIDTLKRVQ